MGAWVRKPLIARRASKAGKTENNVLSSSGQTQADGQPGEADDKENDEAGMVLSVRRDTPAFLSGEQAGCGAR